MLLALEQLNALEFCLRTRLMSILLTMVGEHHSTLLQKKEHLNVLKLWLMLLTSLWGFNGYTPPGMRHCEVLDRDASEILFAASRMAKELGKDAGSS